MNIEKIVKEKIDGAIMAEDEFFHLKKIEFKTLHDIRSDLDGYLKVLLLRYLEECSVLNESPDLINKIRENNLSEDEDPIILLVNAINEHKPLIHEQILSGIKELFEDFEGKYTVTVDNRVYDSDIYSSSSHNNYMINFDYDNLTLKELNNIKMLFAEYFTQSTEELNEGFFTKDMFSAAYPKIKENETFPFTEVSTTNYRIGFEHNHILLLFKKIKELEVA